MRVVGEVFGDSIRAVAGTLLVIGAVALGHFYLAPILTARLTAGSASLVTGGITAAAGFAASTAARVLFPPPKPAQAVTGITASPAYAITGSGNQSRPNGVVPDLLGRHRVFFQRAAEPYFQIFGGEKFAHFLFFVGYDDVEVAQLRIGDTPLGRFDDIEWEIIRNTTKPGSRLFPRPVVEQQVGAPGRARAFVLSSPFGILGGSTPGPFGSSLRSRSRARRPAPRRTSAFRNPTSAFGSRSRGPASPIRS